MTAKQCEWHEAAADDIGKRAESFVDECNKAPDRMEQKTRWASVALALWNLSDIDFDELNNMPPCVSMNEAAVSWNLLGAAFGALRARLQGNKPRIQNTVEGGSRKLRKQAKDLNEWLDGFFYQESVSKEVASAHDDALWADNGFVRVEPIESEIKTRRIRPWNVFVNGVEARDGRPKSLATRERLTGDEVCERYKLSANHSLRTKGRVWLVEAWHLNGKKGRYVASCCGVVLKDEVYEEDTFPVVAIRYIVRGDSYWGQSPMEVIYPTQKEINRQLDVIQQTQRLTVKPRVFIKTGTKLSQPISNEVGSTYTYSDAMPVFNTPDGLPAESYNWLSQLWQKGLEQLRLNEQSVMGSRPAGVNSGEALRTYNNLESAGLKVHAQEFEQAFVDVAKKAIDAAKKLYNSGKGTDLIMAAPGTSTLRKIKWSDVDMKENSPLMRPWPVSELGATPAARKETVTDYYQAQFISKTTALALLQLPGDMESAMALELSAMNEALDQVDRILDGGEMTMPDEFSDAELCVQVGINALRVARNDTDVSPACIANLKRWIREAKSFIPAEPAPAAAPGATNPSAIARDTQAQVNPMMVPQ